MTRSGEVREAQGRHTDHLPSPFPVQGGTLVEGLAGRRQLVDFPAAEFRRQLGADETVVDVILRRGEDVVDAVLHHALHAMLGEKLRLQDRNPFGARDVERAGESVDEQHGRSDKPQRLGQRLRPRRRAYDGERGLVAERELQPTCDRRQGEAVQDHRRGDEGKDGRHHQLAAGMTGR